MTIPDGSENNQKIQHEDLEEYGDSSIATRDGPVPGWLKFSYVFWIVVGLIGFYLFWNGSHGWLDRGYWEELQRAARTTYPFRASQEPLQSSLPPKSP